MSLDAIRQPPVHRLAGRFFLVAYLPTYAGVLSLLLLGWARVPGAPPSFDAAWRTAAALGVGEVLLLLTGVTVAAVLVHPLQTPLLRVLEGYWPRWWGPLSRYALAWQSRRRQRYWRQTELAGDDPPDPARIRRAGIAGTSFRTRYPGRSELLRPTRLGNVLATLEERAGAPYGWDTPVVWPRLYPLLSDRVRDVVDDRRDQLDAAARFSITATICGVAAIPLLVGTGWWLLLTAAPLLVARLAYHAAVHAALGYADAVRVAFDLHRFDLYPALHMDLPADADQEREINELLCAFWRQGKQPRLPYRHAITDDAEDG